MGRRSTGHVVETKRVCGRVYALRFRAYGKRQFVTLGTAEQGWSRQRAELELQNVLADVRRGIWRPMASAPEPAEPQVEPTFHEFASEWFAAHLPACSANTVADYTWQLTDHLLPCFAHHRLSDISIADGESAGEASPARAFAT